MEQKHVQAAVVLKKGEGRSLKAGGAWIYDNEISQIRGEARDGDLVRVEDFDGYVMGQGFLNTRSKIAVRMMTRKKDAVIDEAFLEQRVRDAWNYRKETVDTGSCRVIFGEADFLPGLVVDKFSDVLVVESLALGIDRMKPVILDMDLGIAVDFIDPEKRLKRMYAFRLYGSSYFCFQLRDWLFLL